MDLILAGVMVLTGLSAAVIGGYQSHAAREEVSSRLGNMARHLAADYSSKMKPTARPAVAVFTFSAAGRLGEEGFGVAASNLLTQELIGHNDFIIVSKSRIRTLLAGRSPQASGTFDVDEAVRVGKLLGAQAVILGSVSEEAEHYRLQASLVESETGELVSRVEEAILRSRFETRAKRYLSPTPPKRTFGIYFTRNSRQNPNDVPTFEYEERREPGSLLVDSPMSTVRPTSFSTHFLGIGLRYFPHPKWMADVSAAVEPGPKTVSIKTTPQFTVPDIPFDILVQERRERLSTNDILLIRGNLNWVQPLKYGISGILGAGFSWYEGRGWGHARFSEVVPSIRAGLEYRRRSRWSISLFMNYDILNATAKYHHRWRSPEGFTAAELSKWSVEPTVAFHF